MWLCECWKARRENSLPMNGLYLEWVALGGAVNREQRRELEIRKQALKFPCHRTEPAVCSHARNPPAGHAGLAGIKLPGVEIDARRLLVIMVDPANPGGRVPVREQAKVRASSNRRDDPFGEPHRRDGHFNDESRRSRQGLRMPAETWDAIAVVLDRVNARIMGEAALGQNLKRPQRAPRNRVTGSAIGPRRDTAGVFNGPNRVLRVLTKIGGCQVVNQTVREAVTGDFVTPGRDLPNQRRLALRYPTQDEEGTLDTVPVKNLQYAPGVWLDERRQGSPLVGVKGFFHFARMEVFLNIDANRVSHACPGGLGEGVVRARGSRPSDLPEDDDRELKNAPARPKYKGIQKLLEHGYTPSTRVHVDLQLQPVDSNVISTAEGVL